MCVCVCLHELIKICPIYRRRVYGHGLKRCWRDLYVAVMDVARTFGIEGNHYEHQQQQTSSYL